MAACVLEGVIFALLTLFQCHPVQQFWDLEILGKRTNAIASFQAETSFSLATNVAILIMPMPVIWRLQLALRRRLLLIGIFAIGVM